MRTARRSSWEQGTRINYVAPCWIKSAIRTKEYETWLIDHDIEFGEQEDVAAYMMRIASDSSINGMLRFVLLASALLIGCLIGKSLAIVPRSIAKEGFKDVDKDDYTDDDGHERYFNRTQDT
jgi:hypothetical protein